MTKGETEMSCKHEHLRTVGDRLFCKDCAEELPIEFLTGEKPKERPAPETAAVATETAEIQPAEEKPRKSPAKKKTPKKAE